LRLLKYIFTLLLISKSINLFSQIETISVDNLNLFEYNGTIYIELTISAGNTCNGVFLERSTDTLSFTGISFIDGVCGNSSSPTSYNFVDETPIINKPSYYRIKFGATQTSKILDAFVIEFGEKKFQLRPNPVNNHAFLFFENNQIKLHTFSLYNQELKKVMSKTTYLNHFMFETNHLKDGIYIFSIQQKNTQNFISGQIVVNH
tara:strand:+ start:297 stop:908 length:612 start_codon:yes stop_codon:yes gene_type:complete